MERGRVGCKKCDFSFPLTLQKLELTWAAREYLIHPLHFINGDAEVQRGPVVARGHTVS